MALGNAPQKPERGDYDLARKAVKNLRKRHEQREMQAALIRDGQKCRVPRCEFPTLRVDPAHMVHRGMGGNPKGDRTERKTVIALCMKHHGAYDSGRLEIECLTAQQFDGPCAYSRWNATTGCMEHFGIDKRIGVSVART